MLKKIILSLCVLGVAISTASANQHLVLGKIINETNKPLTIMIKIGGDSGGYVPSFDVGANSHYEVQNYVDIAATTNADKYVRVIERSENENTPDKLSPEVEFTTQWYGGIRPYYTVTQDNITSAKNYVNVIKQKTYTTLIVDHINGKYKYTWKES